MTRFAGRTALVTGAGRFRGIGRAIALRLAADGADVIVSGRARDEASFPPHERHIGWKGIASVADEVRALGRRAAAIDCDVTNPGDVALLVERSVAEVAGVDILVNNAGSANQARPASLLDLDDVVWHDAIEVNLTSVFRVSREVGRHMRDTGRRGCIVNVSSLAGRAGVPNHGPYSVTKSAVIALTRQMALELAPFQIRVNCTCPGVTATDMSDLIFKRDAIATGVTAETLIDASVARIPMRRQGLVDEQAAVVAFLCSDDASYMTGQSLSVNGGLRMD